MDRRDARAWLMLQDQIDGRTSREIALTWETSVRTVQRETGRVRRQLDHCVQNRPLLAAPKLVVFFPIAAYTPQSTCNHDRVPVPAGHPMCCGVCWRSGMDGHPAMQRDPRTDPGRDPKPPRKPKAQPRKTRKEWRAFMSKPKRSQPCPA